MPSKNVSKDGSKSVKSGSKSSNSKPRSKTKSLGSGRQSGGSRPRPKSKPRPKPLSKGGSVNTNLNKRKPSKLTKIPLKPGGTQLNLNVGGKKKDELQVDLEQQFVLRMPPVGGAAVITVGV